MTCNRVMLMQERTFKVLKLRRLNYKMRKILCFPINLQLK